MKIVSWNIRGLGGLEKRKEVRKLVGDLSPSILCLQETKTQTFDASLSLTLWGNSSHAFSYRPSVGASGGLVTIWDSSKVEVWSSESREHVLWSHGRFISSGVEFSVANVYAPCEDGAKQRLWASLTARLQSLGRRRICVCGDFNVVKHVDERRSSRVGQRFLDHIPFSWFIEDNSLVDLPLQGRKFTRFKGDGHSMSRLDRFLLSEEWCLDWPNCKQVARLRGLSDHCALVLSDSEEDWGPRPSRMLKCWGGYVLKEKLKRIKAALKDWHKAHAQNLPSQIDSKKARLVALDLKGEEEDLLEAELVEFCGITSDIHSLSRLHASISWQQSRSKWLKEGDANTKYFHSVLTSRRRGNAISVIQAEGVTVEGVTPIRQVVFSHFAAHFKALNVERPRCNNLTFRQLSLLESGGLTKPFSEAEVKAAVWDCDSYKSPSPDGINFGFYKDFWEDMRGDVMRFISEFHRNGKLAKSLNSTFIALIPKIDSPQRLNDFRPISLVGSLYKILAKVLANKLRLVIGNVVSEAHTTFVKSRRILDGVLIANEVVDEARRSKKELLLFKVDFEKAYDSVD
ncbi:DNA-(apurinic or apyrimidinic site) endonuclease [Trifolium repens]|nr:DNA-(apurinic or apyrimidinic site) endonuclease [Trifolium repens]